MLEQLDRRNPFVLIGVSFGGLLAVEMNKQSNAHLLILISSAETRQELGPFIRAVGKSGLFKLLPRQLLDPPRRIAQYLFGTSEQKLLNEILDDTDLKFVEWAVPQLLNWRNEVKSSGVLKICGTKDKLIPCSKDKSAHLIEGGGHFMIVDRAKEISHIINDVFA